MPPLSARAIQIAADDRRTRLAAFLREFRGFSIGVEFIEIPPILEREGPQFLRTREFGADFGFWNASRLHLQLNKEPYLLLERVPMH